MGLQEYRAKRDFKKTLEPHGRTVKSKHKRQFVIQKHAARRLHYDFRLELGGVLKSWAVPKGPSLNPKDKRLAVETEDHPLDYASFEGTIPAGEYGAGEVIIWDQGEWIPPKNPLQQLEKGHLEFELRGQKLSGHWMLIRTQTKAGKNKNQWLLIKRNDEFAKKTKMPDFISPQLAYLANSPPNGEIWIHEIKFDGYRTLCHKNKKSVQLLTRSGLDWSTKYTAIQQECEKIPAQSAILDGEVVWVDDQGISHFQQLQNSLDAHHSENLLYYVFDLLYLDGKDLRDLPLLERKKILAELLKKTNSKTVLYSDHWTAKGEDVFSSACKIGLEGIVSKNIESTYESVRSKNWIKTKCAKQQEFVIGGFTRQHNNKTLGALLMGAYNSNGDFQYIGRVGTGFDSAESTRLLARLKKLATTQTPFKVNSPHIAAVDRRRSLTFVKPKLVAQIEFGAWTDEKILRHAAYKGLRLDKKANQVTLEEPQLQKKPASEIAISNPDKILFPKAKLTKRQLAEYYLSIEKWILPHVSQRPLALLRCPNGVGKTCFFQKHQKTTGAGVKGLRIHSKLKNKTEEILYIDSITGLVELVQLGTLEIHARGCTIHQIDTPHVIVFDLDPGPGVSFDQVKTAALDLKKIIDRLKLKSFLLVSGGKGLHIHVPIKPHNNFDDVKDFAKAVCDEMKRQSPLLYTTELSKSKRDKKIFLDYLRNGYGATAIVPYSVRAQSEATVAFPIRWTELKNVKTAKDFTVEKVLKILKKRKNPWDRYFV